MLWCPEMPTVSCLHHAFTRDLRWRSKAAAHACQLVVGCIEALQGGSWPWREGACTEQVTPHLPACQHTVRHSVMMSSCLITAVHGGFKVPPVRAFPETFRKAKRGMLAHDEGRGPAEPDMLCSQLACSSSIHAVSPCRTTHQYVMDTSSAARVCFDVYMRTPQLVRRGPAC